MLCPCSGQVDCSKLPGTACRALRLLVVRPLPNENRFSLHRYDGLTTCPSITLPSTCPRSRATWLWQTCATSRGSSAQGFDLADARVMIASALEEMAEDYLDSGRPLPVPDLEAADAEADLIELLPLRVAASVEREE